MRSIRVAKARRRLRRAEPAHVPRRHRPRGRGGAALPARRARPAWTRCRPGRSRIDPDVYMDVARARRRRAAASGHPRSSRRCGGGPGSWSGTSPARAAGARRRAAPGGAMRARRPSCGSRRTSRATCAPGTRGCSARRSRRRRRGSPPGAIVDVTEDGPLRRARLLRSALRHLGADPHARAGRGHRRHVLAPARSRGRSRSGASSSTARPATGSCTASRTGSRAWSPTATTASRCVKLYSAGLTPTAARSSRRCAPRPRGSTASTAATRSRATTTRRRAARPRGSVLWGAEPPERIAIDEHGMKVLVDVRRGQKTGHFLDQRENRRMVRDLARGPPEALNLFGYTGGFSVAAALGGARHVVSVDVDQDAIALARENFRANGLDPADHAFADRGRVRAARPLQARRGAASTSWSATRPRSRSRRGRWTPRSRATPRSTAPRSPCSRRAGSSSPRAAPRASPRSSSPTR